MGMLKMFHPKRARLVLKWHYREQAHQAIVLQHFNYKKIFHRERFSLFRRKS